MLDKPLKKIVFIIYFLKFLILFGQTPAIDFGDQGIFIYSQDSALHEIRDLVTTADGSIFCLLAERKFIEGASKSENNITLLKLNLLGELDPTFATSGVFRNDFPGFIDSYPFDLTITSEEILITGIGINSETSSETVTLKLNNTGMIDDSYGANGSLTYQVTPSVDARAYLLNSNEDTYLYGSAYFELRDETNEFPYVKKHTGGLLDEDFGTNGGQFYDLIFPSNHALPTARVAHVEGGKVFGAIEENNRLLLYGFNHFADGYKSAHVFAVNKETGLLDDTYKANGVNHVKGEVEYNCELKNIVSYKDEHWAGIHNENGIDSDYELYNLNTDNSYTIDFQNKRDELNDICLSNNFMIAVGNITNEINVNNPFFVSNNIGITAFDMNSKTVREQLQFNPRIGHTEYGAEKVRALNNQEVIIAGWGSKGFKKDLILTKWTLNELVPVQKETISIKNWFYPNKVKWREEVNFNSLVTQLKVFALDGKLVLENEFETKQFTTAHLKKGVFYVSYEVEGNVFTNKLIVE